MAGKFEQLVVKMTIMSKDFEKGIKSAIKEMNVLKDKTKKVSGEFKNSIGGITKALGALGIAMSLKDGIKNFMNASETLGDSWRNTIEGMKQTWSSNLNKMLNLNESNGLKQYLKDIATEFGEMFSSEIGLAIANAMDNVGTQKRRFEFLKGFTSDTWAESIKVLRDKNATPEEKKEAENAARKVLADLRSQNAFGLTGANYDFLINKIGDLSELGASAIRNIGTKSLEDLVYDLAMGTHSYKYGGGIDDWLVNPDLGEDTTIKELQDSLVQVKQARKLISDMEKELNRAVKGEPDKTPKTPKTPKMKTTEKKIENAAPFIPGADFMGPLPYDAEKLANDMAEYNLHVLEANDALKAQAEIEAELERKKQAAIAQRLKQQEEYINQIQLTTDAINSIGNAIGSLGALLEDDSPMKAFVTSAQAVCSAASSMIQTYTSLSAAAAAAGAMQSGESLPWPYNLIAIASYAATTISTLATIKNAFAGSFADGGIVPGTSYSGDKLLARVNSGEIILNRKQQNALLNGGSNVRFVIEGSQLKGVLDNYNTINSL